MKLAWGCAGLAFALLATGVLFTLLNLENIAGDQARATIGFAPTILAFGVVGAMIASREPGTASGGSVW